TTTPTTSNTRMTHDINNNHDHTQATHQPPNNQPQYSGERHPGEAGRVTPGKGARTGHVTTQPSTIRHAHNLEYQRSPRHQQRRRPARRPTPRPAVTPTSSNTIEAHAINNDDGQHDDLDLGHQSRPPNRTLLWNTPSTTRRPPASSEPTTPQPAPTLSRGTLRRSR